MSRDKNWLIEVLHECERRYDELPEWKKAPITEREIDPPIYTGGMFDQ